MARTKNPLSSEQASGSFGNQITFKQRRTVSTVARKTNPGNPQTSAQVARRAAFTAVTRAWGSLTPTEVLAWESYASSLRHPDGFGGSVRLPGYDVFVSSSITQQFLQGTFSAEPVVANFSLRVGSVGAAPTGSGQITLFLTPSFEPFDLSRYAVWVQGPLANQNRALRQPEQRLQQYLLCETQITAVGGFTAGLYYYIGVGVCAVGAMPTPVTWLGPFEVT